MKRVLLGVGLACGLATAAASRQPEAPPALTPSAPPPVITEQTRVYTQTDVPKGPLGDTYPERAADADIEGMAVINCQVGDDGGLTRCVVEQENPKGYGFGAATARIFLKSAHAKPDNFTAGDWHRFTYTWTLNR